MFQLQIENRKSQIPRFGAINTSLIGLLLLGVTILVSLIVVVRNVIAIERPDKITLRVAHWQLESGYREAIDAIIADYEKAKGYRVKVVQMPVTEKVYAQWINTQMISGTAPDVVEVGQSLVLTKDENTIKYFIPLSDKVGEKNPYNAGTDLDGLPWKETFIDGMRGGYRETLQDYYTVPTSMMGMRLFVNTTLLQEITGSPKPPESLGELISICQKVREYSLAKRGGAIVPLVSNYGHGTVIAPYQVPFTAGLETLLDKDLDGVIGQAEAYRGMFTGEISFSDTPNLRELFAAMKQLCDQMQKGFAAMDRQAAQFTFVNGNAAFLSTGSWDARSIYQVTDPKGYKLALIEWPLPKPGEPFADVISGRANEAAAKGSGPYGIYKNSPHKELALDFLHFLTSKTGNEKFNRLAEWPPVVVGAEPADVMKPFMPDPIGYTSSVNLGVGTKLNGVYTTELLAFLQGEKSLGTMQADYLKAMKDPLIGGDWAAWSEYDQRWRDCRNQERLLARDAAMQVLDPGRFRPDRYQRTLLQQTRRNNGREVEHRFELFRGIPLRKF